MVRVGVLKDSKLVISGQLVSFRIKVISLNLKFEVNGDNNVGPS
jgi:hypothetical protein